MATLLTSIPYYTLVWMTYCICEGWLHAYYYAHHVNSTLKENFNEHPLFVAMRACVLALIFQGHMVQDIVTIGFLGLLQPFYHNGSYYYHRNKLDGSYPYGWFDHSRTSIAWTTKFLTPFVRVILAAIGVIGLFCLSLW